MAARQRYTMFKAVLFDLDNTLCDVVLARKRYAAHAARLAGAGLDPMRLHRAAVEGLNAVAELLKGELCARSATKMIYSNDIAMWVEGNEVARRVVRCIAKRSGVGVVTNGRRRTQIVKLRRTLGDMALSPIVVSGAVGHRKPGRRIFEHALARLGMPAHAVLFVGDDPVTDMLGAARVGLGTCWLSYGRSPDVLPCTVDYMIGTLDELPEVVHA